MATATSTMLAPGRGKPGKEMRKAQGKGFKLLGHCDFGGPHKGDVMQLMLKGNYLLCGHMGLSGAGISVLDVSDSSKPRLVNQIPAPPNTHHTKLQLSGDILIANCEQAGRGNPVKAGIEAYDVSRLPDLRLLSFFPMVGRGCHRMWFVDGRYAFLPGSDEGYLDQFLRILDLSNPSRPEEVGRWWVPGMRKDEKRDWYQMPGKSQRRREGGYVTPKDMPPGMTPKRVALHTPYAYKARAYCAWWDSGFIILDISDIAHPKYISSLDLPVEESASTHSVLMLPERKLCVVVDEFIDYACEDMPKQIRVVDISDERKPKVLSMLPVPEGDFVDHGGRFGPHNLHENRPGSLIDQDHVYQCYFNGGLRVYDIKDPRNPKEVAYYIPETPNRTPVHVTMAKEYQVVQIQVDDVYVAPDGRVFISERLGGGVWVLEKEF